MQQYHTKCLITQSQDLVSLKGYENHELVKSKSSGLVFMEKIPTQEELSEYYNRYSRNVSVSALTIKRFHSLLDQFEAYRDNNRILDIGCGDGVFLLEAKKRGWEVFGTEFTKESAEIASENGIEMQQGKLNAAQFDQASFDVITSFEVIEHIKNPVEEVGHISNLLRVGGLFYVTTPNFNALERRFLKSKYPVISYPEHLIYFTPSTLKLLMSKAGLKAKKVLTTGVKVSSFKKEGIRKREKKLGGVKLSDEQLRNSIEKSRLLIFIKTAVNTLLTMTHLGNAMKGYFIKE